MAGFHSTAALFRTAWFVESLLTELVIALVVRTTRPVFKSRPGTVLAVSTGVLVVVTPAIPFLPVASVVGFVALPLPVLGTIGAITALYVGAAEFTKRAFFRLPAR